MKTKIGYMPPIEFFGTKQSLKWAIQAENMGFDSFMVDDHFSSFSDIKDVPFAWTWMASALQATKRIFFSTAVTAPIMRYHPAIVAQAFATMGEMYPGRVGLGVGTGEPMNEVQLGFTWPSNKERLEMLVEAVDLMNKLWTSSKPISVKGKYCLDGACVLTKPEEKIPVYFSAMGPKACRFAGIYADHLMTLTRNPKYIKEVVFPNFEAGAKEAGKDPSKMERMAVVTFLFDPDYQMPAGKSALEDLGNADTGDLMDITSPPFVAHNSEEIIQCTDELISLGFNHIVYMNVGVKFDGNRTINVFKNIIPYVHSKN